MNTLDQEKLVSTHTDLKSRWGGILENPYLQKLQRHCLDGYKVTGLKQILEPFSFKNVLDICCGMGEYSLLKKGRYVGLDNSAQYVLFAKSQYPDSNFLRGDALNLPFKDNSFDATTFISASHHFPTIDFMNVIREMVRVSRRYIIIDDSKKSYHHNPVRSFFYGLDRGTEFRKFGEVEAILAQFKNIDIILKTQRKTFPGIHLHATFVAEVKKGEQC